MKRGIAGLRRALFLLLCLLPASCLGSPGGTDPNGGHYNHETGLYHYHHGYPEHQHENGICPYTKKIWELTLPERPATLAQWNAQKHEEGELPCIDNETPENGSETGKEGASALPLAAGGGAAAVVAGGIGLWAFLKRKNRLSADVQTEPRMKAEPQTNEMPQTPVREEAPLQIPEDTVIGEDGLPWEKEAYALYMQKKKENPLDNEVPTNFALPKWGRKYSFCVDEDGEEIHTMDCKLAFIQVNIADRNCPAKDCEICRPVRPDLRWYEELKKTDG